MVGRVAMLGVYGMALEEGQRVTLIPTDNLPDNSTFTYFAAPADGKWSDGVDRNPDDSIAIEARDVEVEPGPGPCDTRDLPESGGPGGTGLEGTAYEEPS